MPYTGGVRARWRWAATAAAAGSLLGSCEGREARRPLDPGLVDLSLHEVTPRIWIPSTEVAVLGDAFVDDPWGESQLRLRGSSSRAGTVDVAIPLSFSSFQRLDGTVTAEIVDGLGGADARFDGTGTIEVISAVDGSTYSSAPRELSVEVHERLTPQIFSVLDAGLIFPNEPIAVEGAELLLPGEGETLAMLEGCFIPFGETRCDPIEGAEVALEVRPDRDGGAFPFVPRIAGIEPGRFEGSVALRNVHASGEVSESGTLPVHYDMTGPILYGASTDQATLGQFVEINGAGFVGAGEGVTLLSFVGMFKPTDGGPEAPFDVLLQTEFVDGRNIRYVVSETDAIGKLLDVRVDTGAFEGLVTPTIVWDERGQEVTGDAVPFAFTLHSVKQVVYLEFLPSYVESLRHFGLRAVDRKIRDRVLEVLRQDFETLSVEIREEEPTDYALFAHVDVAGPDPNGLGLLGYDNTPGKDTQNQRLYDHIGGLNAITQEDGFPGFGGIFIESLLGYSSDPAGYANVIEANEDFDALFDPFRAERGGSPAAGVDLANGLPTLSNGDVCPIQGDRRLQLSCAVWALGTMVGTTISHEIGHSLGLADPYGPAFHNPGDAPNRLMDADRPFEERAQMRGMGPSLFCTDEYAYLRAILPTDLPADDRPRPPCF